jgi:hypothetical protein
MKRIRCRATYNPATTTPTDISNWFNAKISLYEGDEISGLMVLSEGQTWIELEGPTSAVEDERDSLASDPIFADFNVEDEQTITNRLLNRCYFYNEMVRAKATTPL